MIFGEGAKSWAQLVKASGHASWSAIVTAVQQSRGTADVGQVSVGDLVFVVAMLAGTKGATLGNMDFSASASAGSTAVISYGGGMTGLSDVRNVPANAAFTIPIAGIFNVTTAGALTVEAFATSFGSDTLDPTISDLSVWVVRGS